MLNEEQRKTIFKSIKKTLKEDSRNISRVTFLAFAFNRGAKYRDIERTTNWDKQDRDYGNPPGNIASQVLSNSITTKLVSQLNPKFSSLWRRTPEVTDEEWKEATELYHTLYKEVASWFLEPADETVSGG